MDGLSAAASIIAVVQVTGSIVKICGGYIKGVKDARKDILSLQHEVVGLTGLFEKLGELLHGSSRAKLPTSQALVDEVISCLALLRALERRIDPGRGQKAMSKVGLRAMKWPLKRTELEKVMGDLERYKSFFALSLQVDQTNLITEISQTTDLIDQNIDLGKLPVARGAEFDSYINQHQDECLPGTRIELLRHIAEWAVSPHGKPILWLNGMAGTGKSTISRSVAKSLKQDKILGASFFFKRGEVDRGNAAKFIPTITRQLLTRLPELTLGVRKAIHNDPSVATRTLKEQFDKLLYQPILGLKQPSRQKPNVLIVIDALDECEEDKEISTILQLLPQLQLSSAVRLRIFVTSRPEFPTKGGFSKVAGDAYQEMVLHDIPEEVTKRDISLFLNHRLSGIRDEKSLPLGWPGHTNTQALIALSVPLFIVAATICRIFEDPLWDPVESLAQILAHRNDGFKLDGTYLPVLNRLLNGQNEKQGNHLVKQFREVVGAIVILQSPLSVVSLSSLTGHSKSLITLRLKSLCSVLCVPKDETMPVKLFHLSFRDFLLDPETRKKTPFWVDEKEAQETLTTRCLFLCRKLQRNICALPSDGTKRLEIDTRTISDSLSPDLQYSCRFWAQHLTQRKDMRSAIHDAISFLQEHLLHWVETMSILGLVSEVLGMINLLQSAIQGDKDLEISDFLHDAKRFVLKNRQIADETPLQIYCAGLVFAPTTAMVRKNFRKEFPGWIRTPPKVEEVWTAELQTLEGCSSPVQSVQFSPDSQLLASGSYDKRVRLWDSATGALHHTLEGHSGSVWFVAFSPDGRLLASSSDDKTVRVWDFVTGVLYQTLECHSGSVWSVAFSPDSRILASGSEDKKIRLWDPVTGALHQTLEDHSGPIQSVTFSPNGQLIASGSSDNIVRLWDPVSGVLHQAFEGHSQAVWSVIFSPDGQLLASGSWDKTVRLWDPVTGTLQRTLEGHSGLVRSLAFSPDGRLLASGSWDKTVRLWDPVTGTLQRTLEGHSDFVWSVAFSPFGRQLASGSHDKTVRLWDPIQDALHQNLEGNLGSVRSMAFSPDGLRLASGLEDNTVRLWDPKTGALKQTLEGHSGWVQSVAFSPDGELIASGSYDNTIRLWNPATGFLYRLLEGHLGLVSSITFSLDGQLLASGSYDMTVRVWNLKTGAVQQILIAKGAVNELRFSQDASYVTTDFGALTIQSKCGSHASSSPRTKVDISILERRWITLNGNKALWLPPEFRPTCSAVKDSTLALGHTSGKISFIEFRAE